MKRYKNNFKKVGLIVLLVSFAFIAYTFPFHGKAKADNISATVKMDDTSVIQGITKKIGLNFGSISFYDAGQMYKNLIGNATNPDFEPVDGRQIWVLSTNGTNTTFTEPINWLPLLADEWVGGTFNVVESESGGVELGCTGTIVSNTDNGTSPPTITVSSPCAAPFSAGDIIILNKTTFPTPEATLESNNAGFWAGLTGGGKITADTTDLCIDCGKQALDLDASASGSYSDVNFYFDSASNNQGIFILVNGTYNISFWAKVASGSPVMTVGASRLGAGFNCPNQTVTLSSTWTKYTIPCIASETAATSSKSTAKVNFSVSNGSVYFDNASFEKTNSDQSNTTIMRDKVINTLKDYYKISAGGNPGMFRYWMGNQNAETIYNWTEPDYNRDATAIGPDPGSFVNISLEDYLNICKFINAEPYIVVPITISNNDSANLIEFLSGSSSTTFGARRIALGQTVPWTSVFNKIHLSFGNESWNSGSFPGQSLPWRSNAPNPQNYYDYSVRAKSVYASMRAAPDYSSSFDLVMNAQTATSWGMDQAVALAHPDTIELAGYTYSHVDNYQTDAELWGSAMVEPYEFIADPNDLTHFYQSAHDYLALNTCGASGSSACKISVYEWGQNTLSGNIDQVHTDYINAGAGEGIVSALEPLLFMQYYGITADSYFALAENSNSGLNSNTVKLWGNVVDMGGPESETNSALFGGSYTPRPQFLALSLVNQSIIGPMYSCNILNNFTYDFPGSSNNGPVDSMSNVPYLYSFCFENGNNRSVVLVNSDLTNSHSVNFSGINIPTGNISERIYAPTNLNDMNEPPTGTPAYNTPATVYLTTASLFNPSSITLAPHSIVALDYTIPVSNIISPPSSSISSSGSFNNGKSGAYLDGHVGGYYFTPTSIITPAIITSMSTKASNAKVFNFTVKMEIGSKGDSVTELQNMLTTLKFYTDKVDGIFGNITQKSVKEFQAKYSLLTDGIVGPLTLKMLNSFNTTTVTVPGCTPAGPFNTFTGKHC